MYFLLGLLVGSAMSEDREDPAARGLGNALTIMGWLVAAPVIMFVIYAVLDAAGKHSY